MVPTAGLMDHVIPELVAPVTAAMNRWLCELVRYIDGGKTATVGFCPAATPCSSRPIANRPGTDTARPERVGRTGRKERIAEELALVHISFIVIYPDV